MENSKQLVLKKHVNAIHCANTISLVQRKVANALLYNAYEDLLKKDKYQISVAFLCKLIGYNSNDHKVIKEALTGLMSTVIQWNVIDESVKKSGDKPDWKASTMLADTTISGSTCSYSYSGNLKELFYMPAIYGRLDMTVLARFKSSYGIALYENCIRYQAVHQTPWLDMVTFRKLMGVGQGEYLIFRDLKRRVIDKAIEEVNKLSTLKITSSFKRQNRQVTEIKFFIEMQNTQLKVSQLEQIDDSTKDSLWHKLEEQFGLSNNEVENILKNYDEEYIKEKIELVENSKSYNQGQIRDLANYLVSALEKNYKLPISSKQILINKQKKHVEAIKQAEDKQLMMLRDYDKYQAEIIETLLYKIDENERKILDQEFLLYLQRRGYKSKHKIFLEKGLQDKTVKPAYFTFIKDCKIELIPALMSFDEYKNLHMSNSID